jgi:cell division protein FtsB
MPLLQPKRSHFAVGVALIIALAVVGGLAWGFGQQLALARQMQAEEARLAQAVATEQASNDALAAQLEYAKSDEYVEYWARVEARMAKPGEVAVVPLVDATAEEPQADAPPAPATEPEARSFWRELWELVFGSPEQP